MVLNYTYSLLILLTAVLTSSCGSDKGETEAPGSPRIKKFSKVTQPTTNQPVVFGEPVAFDITSTEEVDSILLEYGDEVRKYTEQAFSWTPQHIRTGRQKVKVKVYAGDQSETHYARLVILSDITPTSVGYELVAEYPHREDAFIQGLFFIGDTLVESTGQSGHSTLSKMNVATGDVYSQVAIDNQYFGEGSTYWNDRIFYLTWTTNIGFIYNHALELTGQFRYTHEGWGMTTMGDTIVVSDGQEVLHLYDPRDMSEIGTLEVYDQQGKITQLNELEYFNGLIYANVWQQENIVSIDPKTGRVMDVIDLSGLKGRFSSPKADVLNGIAYKASTDQIFVTGKNWPKLFEVTFQEIN